MITDFASLQAAVADWINRDDLGAVIPDFINFGELKFYRMLRCVYNEASTVVTTNQSTISLPPGYLEAKTVTVDGAIAQRVSDQRMKLIDAESGTPTRFARIGQLIQFAPHDGGTHEIEVWYWKSYPPLGPNNLVNSLLGAAPTLFLYAALAESAIYLDDAAGYQKWATAMQGEIASLNGYSMEESTSGSTMAVSSTGG